MYIMCGTGAARARANSAYTGENNPLAANIDIAAGSAAAAYSITSAAVIPTNTTQMTLYFNWTPVGTAGANDWFQLDDVMWSVGTGAQPFERKDVWAANVPDASTTVKGIVELATSAEAIAGTDAVRAITPATLFGGLNASGSAPIFACRAWVNFNGTGTVAIRASGNVSSITDNSTGNYTINFITAMPDDNYSAMAWGTFVQAERCGLSGTSISATSFTINTASSSAVADPAHVFCAVFR
jgi:hypothetical protein